MAEPAGRRPGVRGPPRGCGSCRSSLTTGRRGRPGGAQTAPRSVPARPHRSGSQCSPVAMATSAPRHGPRRRRRRATRPRRWRSGARRSHVSAHARSARKGCRGCDGGRGRLASPIPGPSEPGLLTPPGPPWGFFSVALSLGRRYDGSESRRRRSCWRVRRVASSPFPAQPRDANARPGAGSGGPGLHRPRGRCAGQSRGDRRARFRAALTVTALSGNAEARSSGKKAAGDVPRGTGLSEPSLGPGFSETAIG